MKKSILLSTIFFLCVPILTLKAQEVDLLWQGETYIPPFYEGLPLWSKQSRITFVAIPSGLGNPSALTYKWTKNGTILGNINGVGKNILSFEDTIFSKPQTIKVEIVTEDERVLAESNVMVSPRDAFPLVYENNPLYGFLFNDEVGENYVLRGKEITFTAFPFFTTPAQREGDHLMYRWITNTGEIETGPSVTYRVPDGAEGQSQVSLRISNQSKILLDMTRSFLVQFEEQ